MLELIGIGKLIIAGGSLAGAYGVYRTMPLPQYRSKLKQCFKVGELCITKQNKGKKKRETKVYPNIDRVVIAAESVQMSFTLPVGLDPKEIHKHQWLFKQKFGEHITLEGNSRAFCLKVYQEQMKPFSYNFEEIENIVEGLKLPIIAGKSREGYEAYDMVEHPHLLITGLTGSGKSTILRSILSTLILSKKNIQLYCGDMKRSEFHLFKGIAEAVAYDERELFPILQKIAIEMIRRGNLLDQSEVAHIDDLEEELPYIVLCIDEFALLKGNTKIMDGIEAISSIGRALGVFLILSCLRPDAEVMDGKLKQNLTVRMACRTDSEINSRIVLGTAGAEQIGINEKGLMLFKFDSLKKVQSPNLELKKAQKLLQPFKKELIFANEPVSDNILGGLESASERQSDIE